MAVIWNCPSYQGNIRKPYKWLLRQGIKIVWDDTSQGILRKGSKKCCVSDKMKKTDDVL